MTHFTSIFFKSVEFFKNHFSCPVHKNSTDLKKIEAIFSERIAYPRPEERNQQPTTTKPTIMASFDVTMTKAMETAAQGMINEALTFAIRKLAAHYKFSEDEAQQVILGELTLVPELLPVTQLPWCGQVIDGNCRAIVAAGGLYTQCPFACHNGGNFCKKCQKQVDKNGTPKFGDTDARLAVSNEEYHNGKVKPFSLVMTKNGWSRELVEKSAATVGWTVPESNFDRKKRRGRPASASMSAPTLASIECDEESQETIVSSHSSREEDDEQDSITAPVVEPTPAPVVVLAPAPVVEPTPAPVVEPTPAPVVVSAPAPVVEPTPAPVVAETMTVGAQTFTVTAAEEDSEEEEEEEAKPITHADVIGMSLTVLRLTCGQNDISIEGKKPAALRKELIAKLGLR